MDIIKIGNLYQLEPQYNDWEIEYSPDKLAYIMNPYKHYGFKFNKGNIIILTKEIHNCFIFFSLKHKKLFYMSKHILHIFNDDWIVL